MIITVGKSCSFMCVRRESLSVCVCASFPVCFECGMWELIVLHVLPYHCLSFYF